MIQTVFRFLRPTAVKLVFTAEWLAFILLQVARGHVTDVHQLQVALWPFLLLYLVGCTLVAGSRQINRLAGGRGLALLIVASVFIDQAAKLVVSRHVVRDEALPLVEGWLHLTNVHNEAGSFLAPMWFKPLLALAAVFVLPLSITVYRYYVSARRRSLWVDLTFVGIFGAYLAWLCDASLRGFILDFLLIPHVVAFDSKDVLAYLGGASAVAELLSCPRAASLRWQGWRAELEATRRLVTEFAAFVAKDLRSWWPFRPRGPGR